MVIAPSPYYPTPTIVVFTAAALVYSAVSHLIFGCFFYPLGFRLYQELLSTPTHAIGQRCDENEQIVIITGSNTGIGLETARELVSRGYTVIMACRSRDRALAAVETITPPVATTTTGKAVFVHPLDLSNLESIKDFSTAIAEKYDHIDVLINNAGRISSGPCGEFDLCFHTNFLGHFCLTRELMPLLLKNKGRVINLSSLMHHYTRDAPLHDYAYWKNCALYGKHVPGSSTYPPSKLAALLFTLELRKRFPELTSIAVNPGAVNSDIWRGYPRFIIQIFRLIFLNNRQGCTCSVAAVLLREDEDTDLPLYLQPYWQPIRLKMVHPILEGMGLYAGYVPTRPRLPPDNGVFEGEALWKASEDVSGCKFELEEISVSTHC